MAITALSSREFNQDTSRAKRVAEDGPVSITDRGEPAHLLLSIEAYRRLTGGTQDIVSLLGLPADAAMVDFDPPKANLRSQPADLG